jgi:hypothetical protein
VNSCGGDSSVRQWQAAERLYWLKKSRAMYDDRACLASLRRSPTPEDAPAYLADRIMQRAKVRSTCAVIVSMYQEATRCTEGWME